MAMPKIHEYELPLSKIVIETPETKTFRFFLPKAMPFAPGQWVMITKEIDGEKVARPFSIATSPTAADYFDITIKHMEGGIFSTYMCERVQIGEVFKIKGPYGLFTFRDDMRNIMLIGAGSGIVPLMCMMRYIYAKKLPTHVTLLYSSKTEDYIIYRRELDMLENNGMRVVHTMTRDPNYRGYTRRIDKEMIREVAADLDKTFFICGPPQMVDSCVKDLQELGVPNDRIKTERYD